MDKVEYEQFVSMLNALDPQRQRVFMAALQLFMQCCQEQSEISAVLVVRKPVVDDWTVHISALNADKDDAYEILELACSRVAKDICEEAPSRERYN